MLSQYWLFFSKHLVGKDNNCRTVTALQPANKGLETQVSVPSNAEMSQILKEKNIENVRYNRRVQNITRLVPVC